MPIRHDYINGSDNLGQYKADEIGRQACTVAEVHGDGRFSDAMLYAFSFAAADVRADPWYVVTLDKYVDGRAPVSAAPYIVEYGTGRTIAVPPDWPVFVAKSFLVKVGIAIPESRYDAWKRERGIS